jgi:hypothetical protein
MRCLGCERFFSIASYVSNPRQTQLKVKHYEAMEMLKRNMQQIYINEDWVVEQYQHMEKTKGWELMETQNDQLVGDLEAELYAEDIGVPVEALQLEDLEEKRLLMDYLDLFDFLGNALNKRVFSGLLYKNGYFGL